MEEVRIGIVGIGNMGKQHALMLLDGKVKRARLGAVCDGNPAILNGFDDAIPKFSDVNAMIGSGTIDAILIATPHSSHAAIGALALQAGIHTLVEKPISVHKADCERLIAAHRDPRVVFCAMFNLRTNRYYQKIRDLVRSGDLGRIRRVNWINTNWFRTEAYYASGGWRATWKGEGGGVLTNQCPHNIDLFQWIFGMPAKVRAFCSFGKYHNIEVEDEVTAYLEFADGGTAVFIASTGEAPGTNRLEITAEFGRVIYENDCITWDRNEIEMTEFSRTTDQASVTPGRTRVEIAVEGKGGRHTEILENFTDAILDGAELLAPGAEGIHSVELANAMILSSLKERTIALPIDAAEYEAALNKLIAESQRERQEGVAAMAPVRSASASATHNVPT